MNNQILALSEPVERMYAECTAQLIINIAKHFSTGKGLATRDWQLQKLSELGQLTDESVRIIAQATGEREEIIIDSVYAAAMQTLEAGESVFSQAAKTGAISTRAGDIATSERVQQVIRDYAAQTANDLNLVNTVMLDSVQQRYRAAISQMVAYEEAAKIQALTSARSAAELAGQMSKTQSVLNAAAGAVNLGTETRQQAVRQAIQTLAKQGITGFIDKGGHQWSPEAYVNMDVRTTVHNTAIQAQKARSADYGVDTFQISTKAGARPLCAPYQGWICAWGNWAGTVEDGDGKKYEVHPLSSTSYGEPAGIFGINCGHFPETFIPGYSYARYEELNPEEERKNAVQYEQSQKQRYFERQVRQAKTEALAYDAAGDKEAFDKAALQVKQKTAQYKAYCDEVNRTPRLDRTQVVGYNRSVSGKVTQAVKHYNPEQAKVVAGISGARITDIYGKPAQTHAEKYYGLVRSMRTDVSRIARNTGYSTADIGQIKDFLFNEKHDLGGGRIDRFDPDFAIAQSWQRLIDGKPKPHDLTLLKHETMERELMRGGMSQYDAHIKSSEKYNYTEEVRAYYADLKKHNNK